MSRKQRKRLDAQTGQGQLIMEIFENHGGAEAVADKSGLSISLISYWRSTEHVPLGRVGELSRALGEGIYAFNYEGVAKLLGQAPKWEAVVKACKLSDSKTRYVLSKKIPKPLKELL